MMRRRGTIQMTYNEELIHGDECHGKIFALEGQCNGEAASLYDR